MRAALVAERREHVSCVAATAAISRVEVKLDTVDDSRVADCDESARDVGLLPEVRGVGVSQPEAERRPSLRSLPASP
jgi:hypothetical protein